MTGDLHDTATYTFSTDWFTGNIPTWNSVIARIQPARFLEIGSYEGRSACHVLTEAPGPDAISLHCIDPWSLGEGQPADHVGEIEQRFDHNVAVALGRTAKTVQFVKIKEFSTAALPRLLTERGPESYDFIYVDGSHTAPDVLFDAVLAFRLLKVGGVMIFDDYLWTAESFGRQNHYNLPKPAIDAFVNIHQQKLAVLVGTPLYQLSVQKIFA
jgi:predicted O-methyltransferase YrrM